MMTGISRIAAQRSDGDHSDAVQTGQKSVGNTTVSSESESKSSDQLTGHNKNESTKAAVFSPRRSIGINLSSLVEVVGAVALSVGMILAAFMVKSSFDAFIDSVASPLDSIAASFRDGIHMRHHFTDRKANQKR
jgi:hypothetical protein